MPALSLTLVEFSDKENSRIWTLPNHSAMETKLVKQDRKVPTTVGSNAETRIQVVRTTKDAQGLILPNKVAIVCDARFPVSGLTADLDAAIADFRAIVASDEFVVAIKTQNYLKA